VLFASFFIAALAVSGCTRTDGDARAATERTVTSLPPVRLQPAFPSLVFERPVALVHAGDGSDRLFVVEQRGRILVFPNDRSVTHAEAFLALTDRVNVSHNEEGLLSLAFHPSFEENGRFFVFYSADKPRRGVLAEIHAPEGRMGDAASERRLLEVEEPWGNHNGSTLVFGPDGYLYVSLGDGGSANDPLDSGQDRGALLGSILRIDVDRRDEGKPYGIPPDNPFVGMPGARAEVWAKGLRNVWRMSFDRETGELWAGDVGQNEWEEIDRVTRGGNYGWRVFEGTHPFRESAKAWEPAIPPIVEYSHEEGASVTGGHVYRGKQFPSLTGIYFYADYVTGHLWGLRAREGKLEAHARVVRGEWGRHISSFGEDEAGEIYVCAFDHLDGSGGSEGRLYRIEAP